MLQTLQYTSFKTLYIDEVNASFNSDFRLKSIICDEQE